MSYPHGVAPPPYSAVPVSYNVILYLSMYISKVNTVACKQSRVVWRFLLCRLIWFAYANTKNCLFLSTLSH